MSRYICFCKLHCEDKNKTFVNAWQAVIAEAKMSLDLKKEVMTLNIRLSDEPFVAVTRSTTKALSVSPTERTGSPDVSEMPSQSTPGKLRTRRASLAETPKDLVLSPLRRSRRISTTSDEVVATPTKARNLRSARSNLTLIEQPVPEEDEAKRDASPPRRGRKRKFLTGIAVEKDEELQGSTKVQDDSKQLDVNEEEHTKRENERPKGSVTPKKCLRSSVVVMRKLGDGLEEKPLVKPLTSIRAGKLHILSNKDESNASNQSIETSENGEGVALGRKSKPRSGEETSGCDVKYKENISKESNDKPDEDDRENVAASQKIVSETRESPQETERKAPMEAENLSELQEGEMNASAEKVSQKCSNKPNDGAGENIGASQEIVSEKRASLLNPVDNARQGNEEATDLEQREKDYMAATSAVENASGSVVQETEENVSMEVENLSKVQECEMNASAQEGSPKRTEIPTSEGNNLELDELVAKSQHILDQLLISQKDNKPEVIEIISTDTLSQSTDTTSDQVKDYSSACKDPQGETERKSAISIPITESTDSQETVLKSTEPCDDDEHNEFEDGVTRNAVQQNEVSINSPEKIKTTFAKSWNQSIKGSVHEESNTPKFIDAISVRGTDTPDISPVVSARQTPEISREKWQEAESGENGSEEEGDAESSKPRNEFLDDEAMEASDDEDSLNSSERAYLEANEIPIEGESLGSENTFEEEDSENDEMGSFIVSESENDKLSGNDSLMGSEDEEIGAKKRYNRIIEDDDTSSGEDVQIEQVESNSEREIETMDASLQTVNPDKLSPDQTSDHNDEKISPGKDVSKESGLDVSIQFLRSISVSCKKVINDQNRSKAEVNGNSASPKLNKSSDRSTPYKVEDIFENIHLENQSNKEIDAEQKVTQKNVPAEVDSEERMSPAKKVSLKMDNCLNRPKQNEELCAEIQFLEGCNGESMHSSEADTCDKSLIKMDDSVEIAHASEKDCIAGDVVASEVIDQENSVSVFNASVLPKEDDLSAQLDRHQPINTKTNSKVALEDIYEPKHMSLINDKGSNLEDELKSKSDNTPKVNKTLFDEEPSGNSSLSLSHFNQRNASEKDSEHLLDGIHRLYADCSDTDETKSHQNGNKEDLIDRLNISNTTKSTASVEATEQRENFPKQVHNLIGNASYNSVDNTEGDDTKEATILDNSVSSNREEVSRKLELDQSSDSEEDAKLLLEGQITEENENKNIGENPPAANKLRHTGLPKDRKSWPTTMLKEKDKIGRTSLNTRENTRATEITEYCEAINDTNSGSSSEVISRKTTARNSMKEDSSIENKSVDLSASKGTFEIHSSNGCDSDEAMDISQTSVSHNKSSRKIVDLNYENQSLEFVKNSVNLNLSKAQSETDESSDEDVEAPSGSKSLSKDNVSPMKRANSIVSTENDEESSRKSVEKSVNGSEREDGGTNSEESDEIEAAKDIELESVESNDSNDSETNLERSDEIEAAKDIELGSMESNESETNSEESDEIEAVKDIELGSVESEDSETNSKGSDEIETVKNLDSNSHTVDKTSRILVGQASLDTSRSKRISELENTSVCSRRQSASMKADNLSLRMESHDDSSESSDSDYDVNDYFLVNSIQNVSKPINAPKQTITNKSSSRTKLLASTNAKKSRKDEKKLEGRSQKASSTSTSRFSRHAREIDGDLPIDNENFNKPDHTRVTGKKSMKNSGDNTRMLTLKEKINLGKSVDSIKNTEKAISQNSSNKPSKKLKSKFVTTLGQQSSEDESLQTHPLADKLSKTGRRLKQERSRDNVQTVVDRTKDISKSGKVKVSEIKSCKKNSKAIASNEKEAVFRKTRFVESSSESSESESGGGEDIESISTMMSSDNVTSEESSSEDTEPHAAIRKGFTISGESRINSLPKHKISKLTVIDTDKATGCKSKAFAIAQNMATTKKKSDENRANDITKKNKVGKVKSLAKISSNKNASETRFKPLLDDSTTRDLDSIIATAKKQVLPSEDNESLLKAISKLVSKSLKILSEHKTAEDPEFSEKKCKAIKKQTKKKRLESGEIKKPLGVSHWNTNSESGEVFETVHLSGKPKSHVLRNLKSKNRSKPANAEKSKSKITETSDPTEDLCNSARSIENKEVPFDASFTITDAKKRVRREGEQQTNEFETIAPVKKKRKVVKSATVSLPSSDNSFENYLPSERPMEKVDAVLKRKIVATIKPRKFGQESKILQEKILNRIEEAKRKGKIVSMETNEKNRKRNPNIPNEDQLVSAFAAYRDQKKVRQNKPNNDEDKMLKLTRKKSAGKTEKVKRCKGKAMKESSAESSQIEASATSSSGEMIAARNKASTKKSLTRGDNRGRTSASSSKTISSSNEGIVSSDQGSASSNESSNDKHKLKNIEQHSTKVPKNKKTLGILNKIPSEFRERSVTRKKTKDQEVTKTVAAKVRTILSAGQKEVPLISKKSLKNKLKAKYRPDKAECSSSPEQVWATIGDVPVTNGNFLAESWNEYRPKSHGAKTAFAVQALKNTKRKVSEPAEHYSSTALDFKRRVLCNDRVERESSKDMLRKKIKRKY